MKDKIIEAGKNLKTILIDYTEKDGFQTFPPRAFASVQGTFFSLFTIDEIIDPEKIIRNYSEHGYNSLQLNSE